MPAQAISLIKMACGGNGVGGVGDALGVGVSEGVSDGVIVRLAVAVGLASLAVDLGEALGVGEAGGSSGVGLGVGSNVGVEVGSDGLGELLGVAVDGSGSRVGVSEVSLEDSARDKRRLAAGPSWAKTKTTIPKTAPTCLSILAGHGVLNTYLLSRSGGGSTRVP